MNKKEQDEYYEELQNFFETGEPMHRKQDWGVVEYLLAFVIFMLMIMALAAIVISAG